MSSRERDRPSGGSSSGGPGHPHPSANTNSSSSSSALSFLPSIFGRSSRAPAPAPPTTSRAHASADSRSRLHDRKGSQDRGPSPSKSSGLGAPAGRSASSRRTPSPVSFSLKHAISLMEPEATSSTAELCEIVKATAVWLANLLLDKEDIFGQPSDAKPPAVSAEELHTLYTRAIAFAAPKSETPLRIAALRLLAALIATAPPPVSELDMPPLPHPAGMTRTRLYALIIAPTNLSRGGPIAVDEVFVEVGALKALTLNGRDVQGLGGLVGWLVKALTDLRPEWVGWCKKPEEASEWGETIRSRNQPFGPIKPASPAEVVLNLVDLLHTIISHHAPLFSPSDLARIIQPILDLVVAGMTTSGDPMASMTNSLVLPNIPRRGSSGSTAVDSPGPLNSLGLAMDPIRHSAASNLSRRSTLASSSHSTPRQRHTALQTTTANNSPAITSPQSVASPQFASPSAHDIHAALAVPKWCHLLPSLGALLELVVTEAALDDDTFEAVVGFLCFCFGQDDENMMGEAGWTALHSVMAAILGAKTSRRGELAIRGELEGTCKIPFAHGGEESERRIVRGAVMASRMLLDTKSSADAGTQPTLSTLTPSLCAAQSTSRFPDPAQLAERQMWQPVNQEILALLQDHLQDLENGLGGSESNVDAWTEGEAACEIMKGMVAVAAEARDNNTRKLMPGFSAENGQPLTQLFQSVLHQIPGAIDRLHASTSTSPSFQHPKYIALLLSLSSSLSSQDATAVLDYYQRECLCLPFTTGWIDNIWKLFDGFFGPDRRPELEGARARIARMVFKDVYSYADDLPEHRIELVDKAIVPFLERVLQEETSEDFVHQALEVLVSAAVAETMERDEERRRAQIGKAKEDVDKEDAAALPSDEHQQAVAGGSFHAIRRLILRLASMSPCAAHTAAAVSPPPIDPSGKPQAAPSKGLRGLMGALSPSMTAKSSKDLPSVGSPEEDEPTNRPFAIPSTAATPTPQLHSECKSRYAVAALIAIFTRLSFAPPHSLSSTVKAARTPASSRSISIYRDLLSLLFPMTDDRKIEHSPGEGNVGPKIPARCPKARLTILQWLMRLRADSKHRIYLRVELDRPAAPFAATLKRTAASEQEAKDDLEEAQARRRPMRPQAVSGGGAPDDRGRADRGAEAGSGRSRSRSRQPISMRGAAAPSPTDAAHVPLWRVPEEISFEIPADTTPSQGMTTYDPNHPSLKDKDAPPVEGVWLPVSEYVRVLNGILRGHDWELVSYVLTFLPLQLSNKMFFHGGRATSEVRALLDVLCQGVTAQGAPWERRFNAPPYITRVHINAAAYQALSILIAYRGVFSRLECENLVEAFIHGIQGKAEVAKPCLQALTICIYEMEAPVGRYLARILEAMTNILTTTGLPIHILEFLIALGQNGNLFRNFTDEQYRRVFVVAIDYIALHNAKSDRPTDFADVSAKENYTLSQNVIGMAYYTIYIWFMALKLHQRPNLVSEITRELLKGRSQRGLIDEMAEVCFDWLARYTYGNADPRPATSFLQEVVMHEDREKEKAKTQNWLVGGAIVSITSHQRTGWATVTTTRPTGQTQIVGKLENVPLLDLGESRADLSSLPAVLMANRRGEGSDLDAAKDLAQVKSVVPAPEHFDKSSQHGFIWSGATPSQRRKDVVVEPSYLALQLLSSYPFANMETPRLRIIPNEPRFERALRGIEGTPVIDTLKIAVLYVGPGQTAEAEILSNIDGSPLYLDFLAGLGRLIRLKGQVDVFVGGLNRDSDSDGEYTYAWWDDLTQTVYHVPTMMPNHPNMPNGENKKRLVGNDYIKIVYNDSGREYAFDTIKTQWNFVNIVISPHATGSGEDDLPRGSAREYAHPSADLQEAMRTGLEGDEGWIDWDREDWFKVTIQRLPGIPDFSPIGTHKIVSRRALPILVRQIAQMATGLAARFQHIREVGTPEEAEWISSWRSRLRAINRIRDMLGKIELPDSEDDRDQLLRDFTRTFSYRPPPKEKE